MTEHTDARDEQHDEQPARRLGGKAKIIFTLLAIGVIFFIIKGNRTLDPPKGWINNDLAEARELARTEGRNMLVLFVQSPPSDRDRALRNGTLAKGENLQAVREYNLVAVMLRVGSKDRTDVFEVYDLSRDALPAMVIFDPDGNELGRHEGSIGELDFRDTFLKDTLD